MRITKLDLLAYGHFRGLTLDFGSAGLHVVYGRNEAGKSTTLRAITGLLYGIDRNTPDAHAHKPNELRIGGTLENPAGDRVRIVRRKGNTNTLLDDRGEPVDEVVLKRLLGGVSEDAFKNAFGLDHTALGRGAKSLLEGKGDLGESLFDASVGGGGDVQELLQRLEGEADKLYRPAASKRLVNDALKAFADAQRSLKEKQSLPEAYLTQEKALRDAEESKRAAQQKEDALIARRNELERAQRRVPLERRRDRLSASLADMGPLVERLASVDALRGRVELYERSVEDRKKLVNEAERLRERVIHAAHRAGIPVPSRNDDASAEKLRLDARKEARATTLINDRTRLSTSIDAKRTELARIERELARLHEHAALDEEPSKNARIDAAALERTLSVAVALGNAESRLSTERSKNERRRKDLEARARALGLFEGSLDDLASLRVPPLATIEALEARAATADKKLLRAEDRVSAIDADLATLERQIAENTGDFAPPDHAALKDARARRDEAYARLTKATAAAYERLVEEADGLADRMIREADRVTTLARLRAARDVAQKQRADLENDRAAASAARAEIENALHTAFAPAGIAPLGFAEMKSWLARREQIVEAAAELREAETLAAEAAREVASTRQALAEVLGLPSSSTLAALVDAGTREAKAIVEATRSRDEARRTIAKRELELDERKTVLAREEAALVETRSKLREILEPLGIDDDASAEEIKSALDALREVFDIEAKRIDGETHARTADIEVREFEAEVATVVAELAPDLVGRPAREAMIALVDRSETAKKLVHDLASTKASLSELGDTPLSDEVIAIAESVDGASRALEELTDEIDMVSRELSRLDQAIGGIKTALDGWNVDAKAAEAAVEREQALARLRDGVERWSKAKLAAVVLAREIDRYREENEGPLVASAAKLFARLTRNAFSGVKSGFDERDKPCLRCVRESGVEVDVAGLSEGTRDQLYLSLRLAALLHRTDAADPMPLVLDDVLIQLDDERAGAALSVLAEVAKKMQVLFFTHHARLVEIAKRSVPKDELVIHDLDAASRQGSLFASSPA